MTQTPESSRPEQRLRLFREVVAALLAVGVLLGTILLFWKTLAQLGERDKFAAAKDLLLAANPLLGVVVGYYFNRASTEARAESAEASARTAAAQAQHAESARTEAQAEARASRSVALEAQAALNHVAAAAEKLLELPADSARGAALAGNEETTQAKLALRMALANARRVLSQR